MGSGVLSQDGQAKIGDVGMAKIMSEGYFSHDEAFGTFAWAAPELLLNDRCTDKVDIYRCARAGACARDSKSAWMAARRVCQSLNHTYIGLPQQAAKAAPRWIAFGHVLLRLDRDWSPSDCDPAPYKSCRIHSLVLGFAHVPWHVELAGGRLPVQFQVAKLQCRNAKTATHPGQKSITSPPHFPRSTVACCWPATTRMGRSISHLTLRE